MLSGEDVLCECEDKGDHLEFIDSVVIVPTQNQSVQFVPYSPFTNPKDPLKINKDMIVFVTDPTSMFANQHKQMFGGIVTPDTQIVV